MGHTKTCSELKNIFAALIKQSKTPEPSSCPPNDLPHNLLLPEQPYIEMEPFPQTHELSKSVTTTPPPDTSTNPAYIIPDAPNNHPEDNLTIVPKLQVPPEEKNHEPIEPVTNSLIEAERIEPEPVPEPTNEPNTVSNGREQKKPKLKIRVKQSAASSSVSVDASHRNFAETISTGNQSSNNNSCQDVGSRVTASIGSVKPQTADGEELVKELQCTADSSKVSLPDEAGVGPTDPGKKEKEKEKKKKDKDKDKKRKKNGDEDDSERKRQKKKEKKEKKRKEKEMAKLLADSKPKMVVVGGGDDGGGGGGGGEGGGAASSDKELSKMNNSGSVQVKSGEGNVVVNRTDGGANAPPSRKIKIKIKNRTLGKP